MSDPVDIKIVHINKTDTINNTLNRELVFDILTKTNYEALAPHYKFQQLWVNQAYATFKDFDTYLILMYLKNKIFIDYSDRFHYMAIDAFYSQDKIAIDKINLIQISKSLDIPKETVRRKINDFEKIGILRREGKSIILKNSLINSQRPIKSLDSLVNFIYKNSLFLQAEEWFGDPLTKKEIKFFIENFFTVCWLRFFKLQLPFLVRHRDVFGDLETFQIWGLIAVNHQSKATKAVMQNIISEPSDAKYLYVVSKTEVLYGLNASSISDVTKVPRATVIRKLRWLVNKSLIKKNKKLQYFMNNSGNLNKKISINFLSNREAVCSFLTDIFDLIKNSNFKI